MSHQKDSDGDIRRTGGLWLALAVTLSAGCLEIGRKPSARSTHGESSPDIGLDATVDQGAPDVAASVVRLVGRTRASDAVAIVRPSAIATHPLDGSLYVGAGHRVVRISPDGMLEPIAGTGVPGFEGDGGSAVHALLDEVYDLDFDRDGRLYIVDRNNQRLRRVDLDGTISTYAGTGALSALPRGAGDSPITETPGTALPLQWPQRAAVDARGRIYLAPGNEGVIVRLDEAGQASGFIDFRLDRLPGRRITALALSPDGRFLFYGDESTPGVYRLDTDSPEDAVSVAGGDNHDAGPLTVPSGLVVDDAGVVYIADRDNHRVIRAVPDGPDAYRVEPVAGTGLPQSSGDGGPASQAALHRPLVLALDSGGGLLITDHFGHRIRRVDLAAGVIETIAGEGHAPSAPLTPSTMTLGSMYAVLPEDGALVVAGRDQIWRYEPPHAPQHIAGTSIGFFGDGGPAIDARFDVIESMLRESTGGLLLTDSFNNRIRRISRDGLVTTIAGSGADSLDQPVPEIFEPTLIEVIQPRDIVSSPEHGLLFTEHKGHRIRRYWVDEAGEAHLQTWLHRQNTDTVDAIVDRDLSHPDGLVIAPVRGGRPHVCYGDSGNPTNALSRAIACVDPDGTLIHVPALPDGDVAAVPGGPLTVSDLAWSDALYATSRFDHRLYRVDTAVDAAPETTFDAIAGDGIRGGRGDGGPPAYARLAEPGSLAVDRRGRLLVAEKGTGRVRRVDFETDRIDTVLGWLDPLGIGSRETAWLDDPTALAADGDGGFWITGGVTGRLMHLPPPGRADDTLRVVGGRPYGFRSVDDWREAWAGQPPTDAPPAINARRFHVAVGVVADPGSGSVYVAERGDGPDGPPGIRQLERAAGQPDTLRTVWTQPEGAPLVALALDRDGAALLAADAGGIYQIRLPVGTGPARRSHTVGYDGILALDLRGDTLALATSAGVWLTCPDEACPSRRVDFDSTEVRAVAVDGAGVGVYIAAGPEVWHAAVEQEPVRVYSPDPGVDGPMGLMPQRIVGLWWSPEDRRLMMLEAVHGQLLALERESE